MRFGILGGTFDPVHWGHLMLGQEAYEQYELDRVIYVATDAPQYRSVESAFDHRDLMLRNVIATDPRFASEEIPHTFVVSLLAKLRARHSKEGIEAEYFLIIGGDQAGQFFTWHEPAELLTQCRILVAERALHQRERILDHWGEHAPKLNWLEMPDFDLSASEIRQRVREGRAITYMVPPLVEQYIKSERLYVDEPTQRQPEWYLTGLARGKAAPCPICQASGQRDSAVRLTEGAEKRLRSIPCYHCHGTGDEAAVMRQNQRSAE